MTFRLPVFLSGNNNADYFSSTMSFQDMRAGGDRFSGSCDIIDNPNAFVSNVECFISHRAIVESERVFDVLFPFNLLTKRHLRGGVSRSNKEGRDECGRDIFRKMTGECFCENIGLIPASPPCASWVERDGNEGVGKGDFGSEDCLCEQGSEWLSEVTNKSIFVEVNEASDSRMGIMKCRKESVMCN